MPEVAEDHRPASAVHWGFYIVMIGMPLSGWIMVSASPLSLPTVLFKTIPWPHIAAVHNLPMDDPQVGGRRSCGWTHLILAWCAYGLIVAACGARR